MLPAALELDLGVLLGIRLRLLAGEERLHALDGIADTVGAAVVPIFPARGHDLEQAQLRVLLTAREPHLPAFRPEFVDERAVAIDARLAFEAHELVVALEGEKHLRVGFDLLHLRRCDSRRKVEVGSGRKTGHCHRPGVQRAAVARDEHARLEFVQEIAEVLFGVHVAFAAASGYGAATPMAGPCSTGTGRAPCAGTCPRSGRSTIMRDDDDRKLGDDEKAWLVIALIDAAATLGVCALYLWFLAHASA